MLLYIGVLVILVALLYELRERGRCRLPGPKGLPLVGEAWTIFSQPETFHLQLEKWARQYGPLFELRALNRHMIVVTDPVAAQQVLTQRPVQFKRIALLEKIATELGIRGTFTLEGQDWKRHRRLTAPAFNSLQVKNHFDAIEIVCERLRNKWVAAVQAQSNPEEGVVLNILPDIMRFTLDIISLIAFGYDLNSTEHDTDLVASLEAYMPYIHHRITTGFQSHRHLFYAEKDAKFAAAQEQTRKLINRMIEEFYQNQQDGQSNTSQKSFIHAILQGRETTGDAHLDDDEIFGNAVIFLLAGQDTTANSLAWSLYYLSRNHDMQQSLHDEVRAHTSESQAVPEKDSLEQLAYTSNVIKETLRLRGPSPVMYMEPNEPLELVGTDTSVSLAPGDVIVILNRTITTSDRYYSDPMHFIPDRWNEPPPSSFMANVPFGGGPRVCPGRLLSMFESKMFLGTVFNQFIIRPSEATTPAVVPELADTEDPTVTESLQFTMGPKNLQLRFFLRE